MFWLEDGCIDVLKGLKGLGVKIALVSNWDGSLEKICKDLGIDYYFDYIADSHIVGSSKPDEEIFKHVIDKLYLVPNEVIHVGDLYYADVEGALTKRWKGSLALISSRRKSRNSNEIIEGKKL